MKTIITVLMILFITTGFTQSKNILPIKLRGETVLFSDKNAGRTVIMEDITIHTVNNSPVIVLAMRESVADDGIKEVSYQNITISVDTDISIYDEYGFCMKNGSEIIYLKFFSSEEEDKFLKVIEKFFDRNIPVEKS